MAKVDTTDIPSLLMNPSAYTHVKDDKKTKGMRRGSKVDFANMLDDLRGKTAEDIGPLWDFPVSENSVNLLMDEVRSTGDILKNRPFPDEIIRYKQAVRNFLNYVVQNSYSVDKEEGIANKYKPNFKGRRSSPKAMDGTIYTKIQVVDRKLEDLAALLISSQMRQLEIVSRLEEIRGLLVDLLQ